MSRAQPGAEGEAKNDQSQRISLTFHLGSTLLNYNLGSLPIQNVMQMNPGQLLTSTALQYRTGRRTYLHAELGAMNHRFSLRQPYTTDLEGNLMRLPPDDPEGDEYQYRIQTLRTRIAFGGCYFLIKDNPKLLDLGLRVTTGLGMVASGERRATSLLVDNVDQQFVQYHQLNQKRWIMDARAELVIYFDKPDGLLFGFIASFGVYAETILTPYLQPSLAVFRPLTAGIQFGIPLVN